MSDLHVIPNNDLDGHIENEHCACRPHLDKLALEATGTKIWVHNSYDGREGLEQAKNILKNAPIIFNDRQFKDKLMIRCVGDVSLWSRIIHLFHPKIEIEVDVYCEEIMPAHAAQVKIISVSYLDLLKQWWRRTFNKKHGWIHTPNMEQKNEA